MIHENMEYKQDTQITIIFNKYFGNSINEIISSIDDVQYENQMLVINSFLIFSAINLQDLKAVFKSIRKKPDYTKISSNIILENWGILGNILLRLINRLLMTAVFLSNWKESMIPLIEKVKNTVKSEEYRPINTLKTCEKVIKILVKHQLNDYIDQFGMLSIYQSGFRKRYAKLL